MMKHIFQAALLGVISAFSVVATAAISFDGPKITNAKIDGPGNFSVYNFVGNDKADAAVPQLRLVWGLDNKDNWLSATPNTYFNQNPHVDGGINHHIVAGQFDGGSARDLVIADYSVLRLCYDYNGSTCASESNDLPVQVGDDKFIRIWAIGVADFNGDGKDDVAVIGYDPNAWEGYLAVFAGNGAGGANPLGAPYYVQSIKNGIPLSLAIGNFGGDAKPDLVVATMTANPSIDDGAFGNTFLSTGGSFSYTDHTFQFPKKECYHPSGLISYDPDGAGNSDLVLTCYDFYETSCTFSEGGGETVSVTHGLGACYATYGSGPVISLKNGGEGNSFAAQQTLKELEFPYSSTVGDYNGDGKLDLAVASNGGRSVVTYAGTSPFQVDAASRNDISTVSYMPKYIQTHDMNGDTLPDLILTADQVEFPVPERNVGILDRPLTWDNIDILTYRSPNLPNGSYFTGNYSVYSEGVSASSGSESTNFRSFQSDSPNHATYSYVPNSEGSTRTGLVSESSLAINTLDIGEVPTAEVVPTDGVLVLINHRPVLSTDDPECGGGEIDFRCTAAEGRTIVECTFSSSDAALGSTPAVAGPGNKEWTGKVQLPNDQGVHSFTVTAKDDLGNVHSADFTVDYSKCPGSGGNACPAQPIEKQLSPKDPVLICAFESDPNLAQLNSGKVVTWTQVGGESGLDFSLLTIQGQCLVGPKVPLSFEQNRTIELKYSVEPDGPKDCPARLVYPKAVVEGSGSVLGCSLRGGVTNASPIGFGAMLFMLPLGWLLMRNHPRLKEKTTR